MRKKYLKKCKSSNKGITLIALIITIVVLLILAGVTISQLTGSDSAPAKANEAAQKNDIGTAKDDVQLAVTNALTDAYQTAYVETGVSAGSASTTVGTEVIKAIAKRYQTNNQIGKATIEANSNGIVRIYTTDFEEKGTINTSGGILTWNGIETNSGISILNNEVKTLADAKIGDWLDIGTNWVTSSGKTADWQVLYNDTTNGKIYAIMSSYLPVITKANASDTKTIVENAGLDSDSSSYPYNVWSNSSTGSRDILLSGLGNINNYGKSDESLPTNDAFKALIASSNLTTEQKNSARVYGAPTGELLMESFKEKNGVELNYTDHPFLYEEIYEEYQDDEGIDPYTDGGDYDDNDEWVPYGIIDSLYVPYTEEKDNCYGYWLASPYAGNSDVVWYVLFVGRVGRRGFSNYACGVRPVVILSSDIEAEETESGLWEIQ